MSGFTAHLILPTMDVHSPQSHRARVVRFLALLSSERSLDVLARWMEPERVAFELLRAWFEKIYAPSQSYMEGLRGDFSPEEAQRFRSEFDDTETAALERFHRFLELRVGMIPRVVLIDGRFPLGDSWQAIVKDAGYLLEDLGADATAIRSHLIDRLTRPDAEGSVAEFILHEGGSPDTAR